MERKKQCDQVSRDFQSFCAVFGHVVSNEVGKSTTQLTRFAYQSFTVMPLFSAFSSQVFLPLSFMEKEQTLHSRLLSREISGLGRAKRPNYYSPGRRNVTKNYQHQVIISSSTVCTDSGTVSHHRYTKRTTALREIAMTQTKPEERNGRTGHYSNLLSLHLLITRSNHTL